MTKNKSAQPVNTSALANHISSMTAELATAKADVALLKRLSGAEANVGRLTDELATAELSLTTALADDHEAKRQEAFARIRNMAVTANVPSDDPQAGILSVKFAVTYEVIAYDSSTRQNLWRPASAANINCLPMEALAYLTEAKPGLIPAGIMALAPDSPVDAIRSYIHGLRGY